jgi:hypothetical protein
MSGASEHPAGLAAAEARAAEAEARASAAEATIAQLKLLIEKLRRELYGRRAERKTVLIEQLQAGASEDELRAEMAAKAAAMQQVRGFTRRKPAGKPFPALCHASGL